MNQLRGSRAVDCPSDAVLPLPSRWRSILSTLTEIEQSDPSRYGAATGAFSWIDRAFVSLPPWLMYTLKYSAKTAWDPAWSHRVGLGDHVPVVLRFSHKLPLPRSSRPIPIWLSKHPAFSDAVQRLCAKERHAERSDLSSAQKLSHLKCILRVASSTALDQIFSSLATIRLHLFIYGRHLFVHIGLTT